MRSPGCTPLWSAGLPGTTWSTCSAGFPPRPATCGRPGSSRWDFGHVNAEERPTAFAVVGELVNHRLGTRRSKKNWLALAKPAMRPSGVTTTPASWPLAVQIVRRAASFCVAKVITSEPSSGPDRRENRGPAGGDRKADER